MYLKWFYTLKAKNYWEGFLTSACYNLIHNTGKLFSLV